MSFLILAGFALRGDVTASKAVVTRGFSGHTPNGITIACMQRPPQELGLGNSLCWLGDAIDESSDPLQFLRKIVTQQLHVTLFKGFEGHK